MCKDSLTIKYGVCAELEVKRSRFISNVEPVSTHDAALHFFAGIKKRHYDAKHVVFAYRLSSGEVKSSDAGEPSGTAGKPILGVLDKIGLFDVVAVVSRYFGGVLLGRGGLVRAYSGSVARALESAVLVQKSACEYFRLDVSYSSVNSVLSLICACGAKLDCKKFGANASLFVLVSKKNVEKLKECINQVCAGKAGITYLGERFCEIEAD